MGYLTRFDSKLLVTSLPPPISPSIKSPTRPDSRMPHTSRACSWAGRGGGRATIGTGSGSPVVATADAPVAQNLHLNAETHKIRIEFVHRSCISMRCWSYSRHLLYIPLVSLASPHAKERPRKKELVVGAEEGTAMRRGRWILGAATCAMVLPVLIGFTPGPPRTVREEAPATQPFTARIRRDPPRRSGVEIERSGAKSTSLPASSRGLARVTPPNLTGTAKNCRAALRHGSNTRQADEFRRESPSSRIRPARPATCRTRFSGPIPSVNLTMARFPDRFTSGPASAPRNATRIPLVPCSSSMKPKPCSLAVTSGIHGDRILVAES